MTIDLKNPALFSGEGLVKLNDDLSIDPVKTSAKIVDYVRLITEPIDLIPGSKDAYNEVMHLEPGDILLTFRDWDMSNDVKFYRIAIQSDRLKEYLTAYNEHCRKRRDETDDPVSCDNKAKTSL